MHVLVLKAMCTCTEVQESLLWHLGSIPPPPPQIIILCQFRHLEDRRVCVFVSDVCMGEGGTV